MSQQSLHEMADGIRAEVLGAHNVPADQAHCMPTLRQLTQAYLAVQFTLLPTLMDSLLTGSMNEWDGNPETMPEARRGTLSDEQASQANVISNMTMLVTASLHAGKEGEGGSRNWEEALDIYRSTCERIIELGRLSDDEAKKLSAFERLLREGFPVRVGGAAASPAQTQTTPSASKRPRRGPKHRKDKDKDSKP